jgi:hypothetical protein
MEKNNCKRSLAKRWPKITFAFIHTVAVKHIPQRSVQIIRKLRIIQSTMVFSDINIFDHTYKNSVLYTTVTDNTSILFVIRGKLISDRRLTGIICEYWGAKCKTLVSWCVRVLKFIGNIFMNVSISCPMPYI